MVFQCGAANSNQTSSKFWSKNPYPYPEHVQFILGALWACKILRTTNTPRTTTWRNFSSWASSNPSVLGLSVGRMVCLHCTWQHKGITSTVFSSWFSTTCLWTTSPMTTWLRCMSLPTAATTKSPRFSWTRKLILMPKHWWVHSRALFPAKHSSRAVLRLTRSCFLPAGGWQRGYAVVATAQEQMLEVQSVNNVSCNHRRPLLADNQQWFMNF